MRTLVTPHSGGGGDYLSTIPGHCSSPVWKGGRVQSYPILPPPGPYGPVQVLGVKLVRGAYMDKERKLAKAEGRPDPVHNCWEDTNDRWRGGSGHV